MWTKIAGIILRNRTVFITGILLGTVFMGFQARNVQMSYEVPIYYQRQIVLIWIIIVSGKLSARKEISLFSEYRIPIFMN